MADKAAADPRVRAVCEPLIYGAPSGVRVRAGRALCRGRRAPRYDSIVRAVEDARAGRVRGRRDRADQQGGIPTRRVAVARAHGSAGRTLPACPAWP